MTKQIQRNGSRHMRYEIDHVALYEAYKKKGWINELENIEIPDGITDIDESVVRIPEIEPIIEPEPESTPELIPDPIIELTQEKNPEIENEETKETKVEHLRMYLSLLYG